MSVPFAERTKRLGTETAFAVGAEAASLAATGVKVYPFHLGDLNIPTPEHIVEAANRAIREGKTSYCPTPGITPLREAMAEEIYRTRGFKIDADNVSIQTGGKPVIGKFIMTLMNPGDEVLYPNPGFPIYESMINFHEGVGKPYGFRETDKGFSLDLEAIERQISPRTKLIIYNNYHNPTSAESDMEEMEHLADICLKHNIYVLSDEAYFDILYDGTPKSITRFQGLPERTVILYTFSKKFAMTGWRLGAAIGPREVIEAISRFNVNDESCTNNFVQWAGVAALRGPLDDHRKMIDILRERRDTALSILNNTKGIHVATPDSTFYLFPNVTKAMEKLGMEEVEDFRKFVLEKTGVSFTTRNHFGTPLPGETQKYIRLAYSGIDTPEIIEGLGKMKELLG
ncbi:MAG: aminotransferase class I/II-fold pyridoxal phosphate-dependent enzyme [Thermovirgaceae bacterium]|jgi:aspartate/methionine/tyrosine aminotransferase|nr:aminotransferase class I/II-fold pyridoxal phosphate-dependent enzyme [Synergistales bacterium]MDY0178604.1 aminotransferase class I/II-fold pyridoxal phosphate-dependent enzyme [Synergistaceae bacterium]HRV72065.1 aminotransferase class I/II-fold pyridoxal phosphate-dependent enzyme [Thermovirgaceae bacterium]MDD4023180.1 aminotransferase class I/II-fold pyridoxal phosphate-dependent enzyme [Synergistales bacterium]HPE91961.1 aminotransferase class I/II-fold pyridoxal phosphate-dependent en